MSTTQKRLDRARPRWQRAFAAWLGQHEAPALLKPRLVQRTDQQLVFAFGALSRRAQECLLLTVSKNNVHVSVSHQGTCVDRLIDLDVFPHPMGQGRYADPYLEAPARQRLFASAFALRCTHLYEPLARWIAQELATAPWVFVHRDQGFDHARLLRHPWQWLDCCAPRTRPHADDPGAGPPSRHLFALRDMAKPAHNRGYEQALSHIAAHISQGSWPTVTPSISYWQRQLHVGYHTAAAVHAQLVKHGLIHRASDDAPWRFRLEKPGR